MSKVRLILPTPKHKDQILEYKREFIENDEKSNMDGTAGLDLYETFEEWYVNVCNAIRGKDIKKGWVPSTTYLAISESDERLLGMIDIRHRLNTFLSNYGGHIGYSVRPSERKKGFGKAMLKEALLICKDMRLDNVLLTCIKGNVASEKIIKSNGGFFDKEVPYHGEIPFDNVIIKHYWINLNRILERK